MLDGGYDMFFIITATAAIIATVLWYVYAPEDKYKLSLLCFVFWGATLMWFVDHVLAFLAEGGEFFEINVDAALLGVNVVIIGMIIWLIALLIKDPKGVFNKLLRG
jgi:predicted membrane channel-forming protein YqfA (hemolysin III family)